MMVPRSFWIGIALLVTLIASALWFFGVIPWWGILIAVPVATLVAGGILFFIAIAAWMAGGSH